MAWEFEGGIICLLTSSRWVLVVDMYWYLILFLSDFFLVYTYFYKGKDYWKFDNQKLTVEPGYPKSILKDWMGCDQSEVEKNKDRHLPHDDVDIMVAINDVPSTVNAIAVVIPCILSLCILVLVYTIFQFKNKNVQQHVTYYKHPVQEWVWRTEGRDGPQMLENISEGYYAEVWPVPVFWTTLSQNGNKKRGKGVPSSFPFETLQQILQFFSMSPTDKTSGDWTCEVMPWPYANQVKSWRLRNHRSNFNRDHRFLFSGRVGRTPANPCLVLNINLYMNFEYYQRN